MKKAAFEKLLEQPIKEINVSQFLEALDAGGYSVKHLTVWPEKKKVELHVQPENDGEIKLGDLLDKLQNEKKKYEEETEPQLKEPKITINPIVEKKKVELEVPPSLKPEEEPSIVNEKKKIELELSPNFASPQSNQQLESLLDQLEERIMARLNRGRSSDDE